MAISAFVVLCLYISLCYYIGLKGKKAFAYVCKRFKYKKYRLVYWLVHWSLASLFILGNILRGVITEDNLITSIVTLVGATYLAIFIYLILIFWLVDITKFILRKINVRESVKQKLRKIYCGGISVFLIVFILIGFGVWNAQNESVTNYEVNIDKDAGQISFLNVVMISDMHIGIGIKENNIDRMVNSINQLQPDIVLFCGDIFDESTPTRLKEYSSKEFKNIKSKYGVYAITGNHEYNAGDLSQTISYFQNGNIKFLQDEAIKIADSFYLVGRNDSANRRVTGKEVKPLSDILKDVDKSLPIIVLNHRPEKLEEAKEENVDLQLSGHTHKGQIYPGNLITNYINEKDYGYLKKDNFNLIVSSGYGTWGPPVRIGSKSEIVNIKIKFKM